MAKQFEALNESHQGFIEGQKIFFTASATQDSRVNLSPREIGALRVVDANEVIYLDRTGSGNETAAHMLADGRMTIMFCAFSGPPKILRLYGRGSAIGWDTEEFGRLITDYYEGNVPLGTRQVMRLNIELVQTSCGNGVPLYAYEGKRAAIENWHNHKGAEGLKTYWEEKNLISIDGLPTGLKIPVN